MPTQITLLTERRSHQPWGLGHESHAQSGRNLLNDQVVPAKVSLQVEAGDYLCVETPGGGGYQVN